MSAVHVDVQSNIVQISTKQLINGNDNDEVTQHKLLSILYKQISKEFENGYVVETLNQNHKISFQTYLLLCEELNFENLVFEQERNALEYVTKHKKKTLQNLKFCRVFF